MKRRGFNPPPPGKPHEYEFPPQPDCPSCDGRGWFDRWYGEEIVAVRCPCWERRLILEGPPE